MTYPDDFTVPEQYLEQQPQEGIAGRLYRPVYKRTVSQFGNFFIRDTFRWAVRWNKDMDD